MNEEIIFSDIKEDLLKELNKRMNDWKIPLNEEVSLIDGFFNTPFQEKLSWNFILWWPSVPMIAAWWKDSGMIYYFALLWILPELKKKLNGWEK